MRKYKEGAQVHMPPTFATSRPPTARVPLHLRGKKKGEEKVRKVYPRATGMCERKKNAAAL